MSFYKANSINNSQLTQDLLIQQQFAGFPAINDTIDKEVDINLPYLLDLYIYKNKTTLTMTDYHNLALFARYLVTESVKYKDYPVLRVRYSTVYDYTTVPVINPLSQSRTGKILYNEATGDFIYRFVTATLPNLPTFDVYTDSNIVVTDLPIVFSFGNINFINWLQNNRFKSLANTLETYFDTNFTIEDLIDYIKIDRLPNEGIIEYLSNSLEFIESLA